MRKGWFQSRHTFLLECLAGICLTLLLACCGVAAHLDLMTASLFYLLLVVAFAVYCGFWQASVISLAAILCQTYFFAPPAFSFVITDRRNLVAIIVFEAIVLIVRRLSTREKTYALASELERQ